MQKDKKVEAALQKFKDQIPLLNVLSDEHRQNIIMILAKEANGLSVNGLTEKMPLSRPAISHHLKQLKQVGLVDVRKEGTENYYYITVKHAVENLKDFVNILEDICRP
jgi:ArsR family transcriptional regulator, arsenate/arsenite/antimonite-responsive transcriptional repressor